MIKSFTIYQKIEINLIVIDPADFPDLGEDEVPDITPPSFTLETETLAESYHKRPEDTLRITCSALGKPEPEIIWLKNDFKMVNMRCGIRTKWILYLLI